MPERQGPVLLLSSNARRRYAEDILTALALPEGSITQFRYRADYVAPAFQQIIANSTIIGAKAILAFMADPNSDSPFMIPVRLAVIVAAKSVGDIFVLKLRAGSYPDLEDFPLASTDIEQASKVFRDKLIEANGHYYPAVVKFPGLRVTSEGDSAQNWTEVARRLAQHPTFKGSYFVRVEEPTLSANRKLVFDPGGNLKLSEGKSARVPVSFYTEEYSTQARNWLYCTTDGTFLRVSSSEKYDVALRYDSVEFWLQPVSQPFDALALVTIRLQGADSQGNADSVPLTATVQFPVVIRRSRPRLIARVLASAIGAFLIALPAILGPHSSLQLRVTFAIFGAILLSLTTILSRRP